MTLASRAIRELSLAVGLFALGGLAAPAHAQSDLRQIPALSSPVIDEAGILSGAQRSSLEDELRRYPPHVQLQVWIVDTLGPEPIESLSIRATDAWKLGNAKDDKGALLLIAIQDRQMRIEVGQGLEGDIPDALAGRIIDQTLVPAFRAQDFAGGIRAAAQTIYTRAGGDASTLPQRSPPPEYRSRRRGGLSIFHILIFLIILLFKGFGNRRRGGSFLAGMLLGSMSGRGGSSSSWGGGGGGGWSGGGGGFSGGGSSGRW